MTFEYGDYDSTTPLHHAVREGQISIIEYLLDEEKVSANPKDRWGNSPLDYVKNGTTLEVLLMGRGAKRTLPNNTY